MDEPMTYQELWQQYCLAMRTNAALLKENIELKALTEQMETEIEALTTRNAQAEQDARTIGALLNTSVDALVGIAVKYPDQYLMRSE